MDHGNAVAGGISLEKAIHRQDTAVLLRTTQQSRRLR
jgi:hypothetical protein